MTIPKSIHETPRAQPDNKTIQESKENLNIPKSMQVYHHVLNKVMDTKNEDETESFQNG